MRPALGALVRILRQKRLSEYSYHCKSSTGRKFASFRRRPTAPATLSLINVAASNHSGFGLDVFVAQ